MTKEGDIMRAAIILDEGFEELEAMGPIALLRRAGIEIDMIGVTNHQVTGRFQVTYSPVCQLDEYDFSKADCLILPGGPHYAKLESNPRIIELIHEFANQKILAAICASPTILGHQGLLKGKRYTCFEEMNEDFGGEYVYAYAVTDGNIITGISAAASIEKLCGKEHANKIKKSIYYDAAH